MIFASPEPVSREALARVVGPGCNLDLLIDDIRAELVNRPYDLVAVAGGFQHRTRRRFAEAIRAWVGLADGVRSSSQQELLGQCHENAGALAEGSIMLANDNHLVRSSPISSGGPSGTQFGCMPGSR